jgi:hypothetical protein
MSRCMALLGQSIGKVKGTSTYRDISKQSVLDGFPVNNYHSMSTIQQGNYTEKNLCDQPSGEPPWLFPETS